MNIFVLLEFSSLVIQDDLADWVEGPMNYVSEAEVRYAGS